MSCSYEEYVNAIKSRAVEDKKTSYVFKDRLHPSGKTCVHGNIWWALVAMKDEIMNDGDGDVKVLEYFYEEADRAEGLRDMVTEKEVEEVGEIFPESLDLWNADRTESKIPMYLWRTLETLYLWRTLETLNERGGDNNVAQRSIWATKLEFKTLPCQTKAAKSRK